MKLEITNKNNSLPRGFGEWLLGIIQNKIISSIDDKSLLVWNDYLNSDEKLKSPRKRNIFAKEIILLGATNLRALTLPQKVLIEINPNINVFGIEDMKVERLCRLINYGNTSIKGYPIFSKVFSEVATDIDSYIEIYMKVFDGRGV